MIKYIILVWAIGLFMVLRFCRFMGSVEERAKKHLEEIKDCEPLSEREIEELKKKYLDYADSKRGGE